jgi:sec-independent protein translocase protein TatC
MLELAPPRRRRGRGPQAPLPQVAAARDVLAERFAGRSFLETIEELRRRIIHSAIGVVAGFGICWYFADRIFALMQQPIVEALQRNHLNQKLTYLNPTEPFNMYMKVGLICGLFVASPYVLYQVWLFISPALYRHEKRYVVPFMLSTVGLFLAGGFFGYKVVYPSALEFLVNYGKQFQPMITIGEYTDLFLTIVLGLGIVFELPILVFFLALMGIVSPLWMWRNLRYSILVIFIVAAIITPTADIVNMCVFAAPMIALYIVSIGVAWFVHPSRRKASEEA